MGCREDITDWKQKTTTTTTMIISIGLKSYLYAVFCVINKDAYYIKVIHTDLYLAFILYGYC